MKALLGRKLGMSQVFSGAGEALPVTLIVAENNTVTLRRQQKKDGYEAVQLGLPKKSGQGEQLPTTGKPKALKKIYAARREFPVAVAPDVRELTVEQFSPGDVVEVSGVAKGKGFQGVVKRHHFKGGPASHGHTDWERRPGSTGSRFPQHTRKGKRMPGRMGGQRVTVKNLTVVSIDPAKKLLAIQGAVPGPRGSVVEVRSSLKEEHV